MSFRQMENKAVCVYVCKKDMKGRGTKISPVT